jgi:hypothetical protein
MKTNLYLRVCIAFIVIASETLNAQNTTQSISILDATKQIRIKLGAAPDKTKTLKTVSAEELQQLAAGMEEQAGKLREESKNKSELTQNKLLEEALNLLKLSVSLQIEAFELSGRMNTSQYFENRSTINTLLINARLESEIVSSVSQLVSLAERHLKLAIEMREEANAEQLPVNKLGRLSNADEKELLALHHQNDAIALINKHTHGSISSR